jgi:RNA polymerase sigma factor (sigma-70 family)
MSAGQDLNTTFIHDNIKRMRDGDRAARDELTRRSLRRFEKLARKMLQAYPTVKRWEQTEDVVQNAMLRMLRALDTITPANTAAFFGLAAAQIRRELIDLARHYQGPLGQGANHDSVAGMTADGDRPGPADPERPDELERWRAFHEAVEGLPVEEREVFGLTYYHGWQQAEIAALLQRDERTIRRYWQAACNRLRQELGSEAPAEGD